MVRSSVEALMVYPGSKVDGTVGAVRDSLGWLRRTYHVLEVRKVDHLMPAVVLYSAGLCNL